MIIANNNTTVTYNEENPIEKKLAWMKLHNQTSEQYDDSRKKFDTMFKKYKEFGDLDCTYDGFWEENKETTVEERKKQLNITDDYMDICFCCSSEMKNHKIEDKYYMMDERFSFYIGDDEPWKSKRDKQEKEFKEKVEKLKSLGQFKMFNGVEHQIHRIQIRNFCNNCGNSPLKSQNIEPIIIEPDYKVKEVRATSDKIMIRNDQTGDFKFKENILEKSPQGYRPLSTDEIMEHRNYIFQKNLEEVIERNKK